jgi:preprotein translocase subunit SecA
LGAIPTGPKARVDSLVPLTTRGRIARWSYGLEKINELAEDYEKLGDQALRKKSLSLRYRARSGEPLAKLMVEAYALVREAGRRTLQMRHFDVQIIGGIAMFNRSIVEMRTGEGKTLTATLPMYLYALSGKGALLATVNDYLAKRDAEWMSPIYRALGMKIGVVQTQMPQDERRESYSADVTYGTAKEFGFDFLRDRLLLRRIREGERDLLGGMMTQKKGSNEEPVQRDAYFSLVDEADSILIDEASTPLIISAVPSDEAILAVECYAWASKMVGEFVEDDDYEYDHEKKTVELNRAGRQKVRTLPKPEDLDAVGMFHIYEYCERAIKVDREFFLDHQYVVRDDEIVIVDEFTGRLAEGRKWRDGIHQAIEAKEGVEVTVATGQAARVTVQDYFLRFENLAGMTGTAEASSRELAKIYKVKVLQVPTNKPIIRKPLPDCICSTEEAKFRTIVEEVAGLNATGRPVLIGTRTIDKSLKLSEMMNERGIEHQVLNAHQVEVEADIVAKAGEKGKVTVSTNMAGRGTDIKLGDDVVELGGLHVICTEMHDSARIDKQLIGRCGRQGDPGTFRQYLALNDDLIESGLGPKKQKKVVSLGENTEDEKTFNHLKRLFRRSQMKVEKRQFRSRKTMMYFEKQRKKTQRSMGQDPYLDTPG